MVLKRLKWNKSSISVSKVWMSFYHEVFHQLSGYHDPLRTDGKSKGYQVAQTNKIRKELGPQYGIRYHYGASVGNYRYVAFTKKAFLKIKKKQDPDMKTGGFIKIYDPKIGRRGGM